MNHPEQNRSVPGPGRRNRRFSKIVVLPVCAVLAGGALSLPTAASSAEAAPVITRADTTWKYLQNDTHPSEGSLAWTGSAFDDSSWLSGKGGLGGKKVDGADSPVYDSSNTATTQLALDAPGTSNRVRTYFLRTEFNLTADQLGDINQLQGTLRSDDGVIVYVNGVEVARTDVPVATPGIGYADVEDTDLDTTQVTVPADVLTAGENTVAVALHNQRASSSDVWFDFADLTPLSDEQAGPKPSRIILTPTETPETSQSVSWQAAVDTDTTGKVQIKPTAGGSTRTVKGYEQQKAVNNTFPHFSTTVTGLKPATEYSYRVASGSSWSDWNDFSTADPDQKEFDYIYYGDAQIGLDTTWPSVVKQAQEKAPDAIGSVHAGDLIDKANNNTQWQNWFKGMESAAATTNVMAAPGNHEYSGDNKLLSWKAHFEYPLNQPADDTIGDLAKLAVGDTPAAKQYRALFDHWAEFAAETVYFTDYQGVRFITINATANAGFLIPDVLPPCEGADCPMATEEKGEALWLDYQAQWLDHILSETPSKWNVVTFHQPVYSGATGRDEKPIRDAWVPVFQKHNIDLVQMGHDHVYSRGFNNEDKTATEGITDGPVYIVSNSGAKHYDLTPDGDNVWTQNGATPVKRGEDFSTYQVISVSENRLHYKSYLAEKTPTATTDLNVGDVYDEFTVSKADDGRKAVTEAGVTPPDFEDLTPPPVITDEPGAKVKAKVGDDVTLDVAVDSEAEVSYQWQRKSGGSAVWTDLRKEDESSLVLENVNPGTARHQYRVAVTAGTRTVYSTATSIVVDKHRTSVQVIGSALKRGKNPVVKVRASESGTVRVDVKYGSRTVTRYMTVRADTTKSIKMSKLAKKGSSKARVTVTFTPSAGETFTSSKVVKTVKVRR